MPWLAFLSAPLFTFDFSSLFVVVNFFLITYFVHGSKCFIFLLFFSWHLGPNFGALFWKISELYSSANPTIHFSSLLNKVGIRWNRKTWFFQRLYSIEINIFSYLRQQKPFATLSEKLLVTVGVGSWNSGVASGAILSTAPDWTWLLSVVLVTLICGRWKPSMPFPNEHPSIKAEALFDDNDKHGIIALLVRFAARSCSLPTTDC